MANRRMFAKSITNSSQFLMMPQSSQCLYFHLGMNADDDGYCEHFTIMRMTDSKPDDLKILQAKGFVYIFDDKVLVITQWKENNYLRADRYTASKYLDIYKLDSLPVDSGQPDGIPEVATGKVRKGKDRKGNIIDDNCLNFQLILNCWNNKQLPNHKQETLKRNIKKVHKDIVIEYGLVEVCEAIYNYDFVVNSEDSFYTYKGTLWNFLSRYIDDFVQSADPINRFISIDKEKSKELTHKQKMEALGFYD